MTRTGVATPWDDCPYAKSNDNTLVRARAYRVFLTSCVRKPYTNSPPSSIVTIPNAKTTGPYSSLCHPVSAALAHARTAQSRPTTNNSFVPLSLSPSLPFCHSEILFSLSLSLLQRSCEREREREREKRSLLGLLAACLLVCWAVASAKMRWKQ